MSLPDLPLPTPGQRHWAEPLNASLEALNDALGAIPTTEELDDAVTAAETARDQAQTYAANTQELQEAAVAGVLQSKYKIVNITDFGAPLNGTDDDSPAIVAAIDAVAEGGTVTAPSGSVIVLSGIVSEGKSFNIDFRDCRLIQRENVTPFTFKGGWDTVQAALISGSTSVTSTIGVVDGSRFKVGDVVKVFSDDPIPGARPDADSTLAARYGSFTVVTAVAANNLTVRPRIIDPMVTNVRVAKLSDVTVKLNIGTIECAEENHEAFTTSMAYFEAMRHPEFTGRIIRGGGPGVHFASCFQDTANVIVSDLLDQPGVHNGYGVVNSAGFGGDYYIFAKRVRHAFTDSPGGNAIPAGEPNPTRYGRSESCRIRGEAAWTSSTAWDTHHGGRGHVFDAVKSKGATIGVAVRGEYHTIVNPVIEDCNIGFRTFVENFDGVTSYGHVVTNPVVRRANTGFESIERPSRNTVDPLTVPTITVIGGMIEFREQILTGTNAQIYLDGTRFVCTASDVTSDNVYFSNIWQGLVRGSLAIDFLSVSAGSRQTIFNTGSSTPPIYLDIDLNLSAHFADNLSHVVYSPNANNVNIDVNLTGAVPINWEMIFASAIGGGSVKAKYNRLNHSNSSKSQYLQVPAMQRLNLARSSDDIIVIRTVTGATGTGFSSIDPGAHGGQVLVIYNNNTSGWALVVTTGGASNVWSSAPISVPPGSAVYLVWDSSASLWRKMTFV